MESSRHLITAAMVIVIAVFEVILLVAGQTHG